MATILPKKAGQDNAIATDDEHHTIMANDPSIPQVPQGTTFGSITNAPNSFGNASTFGAPSSGGFNSSGSFGAPAFTNSYGSQPLGNGSNVGGMPASQPQPVLTGAGSNAAQGADVLVANDNTDWINKKWRPVMGWMYMVVCVCDFTLFPILWSVLQALSHGQVNSQWQPVTLQGAGLFHVAMGAVLGIAAYGRTKEKIEGAAK